MSYCDLSVSGFAAALASDSSVPGGGGACALCGALAAALGSMVGSLTLRKKKNADVTDELAALLEESEHLRAELLSMIDTDGEAFAPLARVYSLPSDTPGRVELMEDCLRGAARAPLHIVELCGRVLGVLERFAECGSKSVLSDAAAAAAIVNGAAAGAAVTVKINAASMRDRAFAETLCGQVDTLVCEYSARADEIYAAVCDKLGI